MKEIIKELFYGSCMIMIYILFIGFICLILCIIGSSCYKYLQIWATNPDCIYSRDPVICRQLERTK